ncbi:hypothetical protein ACDX77_19395 [Bacillus velezensis]|uniref:hypothetical protein n=1 Tax=Bacillus velezensis TaxID=492670 RepID=UPI003557484B
MGYNKLQGQFILNKTLDSETFIFLNKLAESRRMKRDVDESIYGIEGEFYVDEFYFNSDGELAYEENILDYNEPPKTQPSLWLQWIPTEEKNAIVWDGGENFNCPDEWIVYLIEKVLKPKGYVLNGVVNAFGDRAWQIRIVDNQVTIGKGEIELAVCSTCGFFYDIAEINMVNHENGICVNCKK